MLTKKMCKLHRADLDRKFNIQLMDDERMTEIIYRLCVYNLIVCEGDDSMEDM